MPAAGYTKAPCHGCGNAPNHYCGRRKDRVCGDCQALLDFARTTQAHNASLTDKSCYTIPSHSHDLPYIPHAKGFGGQRDIIQDAFHKLIKFVSEPSEWRVDSECCIIEPTKHFSYSDKVLMSPLVRNEINTIYNAIIAATEVAHADGKSEGQSLILSLAKGEVAIERFNEAVTKNDERRR